MTVHLILVLWIFTVVYTRDLVWPSRLRAFAWRGTRS
jgi:hypothetical protein